MYLSYQDYRKAWSDAYRIDPPIPLNIDIELASICNLTCPFCFISDGSFDDMIKKPSKDGKSRRRLMPEEMALRIINEAAEIGVPALKFNWRGESTLHPNYSEIMQRAKEWVDCNYDNGVHKCDSPFKELLVNTNANCSFKDIDGLMAATKVMVSLDSLNENTYQIMRRGGSLEKAKSIINELIRRKHPNLWIRRVITEDNKNEDFIGQVKATWGDSVHASEHYCFDRNKASNHEIVGCDHDYENERTYCGYPSQRITITSAGLVYPCCLDLCETMPVGDINKQSIMDIWNGKELKQLREELRNNTFKSETCKSCHSWMSYKRPERNFVQDVEGKAIAV